ncbi:MAG: nicotinate-nucleotide adenylyltransferase [Chthoniobacterales bacterium]|jgi:nicotinate-nucleotide adenylyltransferase
MRTGVFGGSFDPIHHGHLILARAALEELALDRVLFIPASRSPHKTETVPATAADRLAMIELAIAQEPGFAVSGMELQRPSPSYTVDTLRELHSADPGGDIALLIGADHVEKFGTWKDPGEIERLASIAVLARASRSAPQHAWPVVRRLIDVSSTDIRTRVAEKKSIRYLTPDLVCDYISKCGLYRHL